MIGELALATGLRLQEFSSLLAWEIPPLPSRPVQAPIPFPVALAAVHHYLEVDRPATADGTGWCPPPRWGEPLLVTGPDERGGKVSGVRRRWETLAPAERRRLVAPDGGTCILAVKAGDGPFTAWASVFERTANRIRARHEPRFPHVSPTACATASPCAPWSTWSAGTTGRPPRWRRPPIAGKGRIRR